MIKQGLYVATPNWFGKTELKNDSQNIKVANAHTVPNTSNIILKTEGQGNGISRISSLNNVITVTKDTFSKQEIDILTTTDSDSPSDSNVFSAKRTLAEIQELIEQGGGGGSEDNFDDRYIRKDQTDTTNFLLNLLGGIILGDNGLKSNNFSTGILGSGFCLKNLDGDSYLEVDRMLVRKVATFVLLLIQELKHVGGQIILTPASMDCSRVEEFDSYYRCYFDNTDGEKTIEQQFVVGDLARAQTFNKTVNTYYWRAVVGVGDNYIDLSKDDCDAGSTIPNAGDEIVQLGNKTESSRLAAIVLSSYGNDAPYIKMYRGINSYLLDGKEFTSFSRSQVMIIADQLKFSSGESIKDEIDNVSLKVDGTDLKVDEAISDLAENILFVTELSKDLEAVKNLVDGSIETWFYDPVPTLLNIPAINWITTEDKNLHLGDLYYDGNGKAYRFQMSGSNYAWLIITDSDITKALADAKAAQDTADGKRRVFVVAPTNASEYDVGDLWVNATYGEYDNDLLRCKTAKKTNEQWSISHWELASKYTDDTIANAAQEAADAAKQTADDALLAANDAKENANIANALLADIANDNKLTAQEKQQTKKEWDIIVSEKPKNDASADSFKVDRTVYGNAYNTLYAYITPLLLDLTTTSNIVGSTFRNTFKNYYDSRTDLLNAISKKAKSIADAALNTADNAAENALLAIEDAANAKVAADNALQDATEAKERLDSWAEDGVISPTEKQSLKDEINRIDADKTQITDSYTKYSLGTPTKYNNAYIAYRNLLVTLTATSSETIPIPNDFASKLVTYYSERTNALIKISDAAKNYVNGLISGVLGLLDDIKQDVVEAVTNAATALKKANEAANRLNQWASDGVISPTEKLTLKQEQLKLIAEKDAIVVDANKYSVNTTSYVTAFNNYNAELTYHTKSTPENITIRSSFATNQSAYYTAYKSINDAIATAAKKAISDVATDLNGYKSTVSSQFEATNNSIIAAVTSSKEYTNNAVSTVNNDLVLYKEDVSAQFSVLEGEINSKVSSNLITTIKTEILNTAATDATTKANNAKTSAISTAATDATNKANQAKNDAISTAATDATNKVNSIQVGGRNLLSLSNIEPGYYVDETGQKDGINNGTNYRTKELIPINSDYVTLTLYKNISIGGDSGNIHAYNSDKTWIKAVTKDIRWISPQSETYQLPENTAYLGVTVLKGNVEGNWKLETGTKSTDWSPAPEDVTSDIENAKEDAITTAGTNADKKYATITTVSSMLTSITLLSNSISLKADKTEITSILDDINTANNNISSLTTRVSNAEIKLLPDNIWLSVSSRVDTVLEDYATTELLSTSISQLNNKISLKAEKTEVTTIKNNLNQTNSNLSALTTRVSKAEVALQPDNIWIGISSKVTTTSKVNNIVPDSCFDDANYSLLYTGGSRVSASTANNSCPTSYCMKSTQHDVQAKNYVAVAEGEKYYVSAYVNAQLANYTVRVGLILKKSDGTTSWHNNGSSVAAKTSGWQKLSGYITIPAGYTKAGIWFQIDGGSNFGSAYFTKVYAYKVDESVNQNYALLTSTEKKLTTFSNINNQSWGVYNITGLKKGDIITVSFKYEASNLNFNATTEHTAKINCQLGYLYGWADTTFYLSSNGSGKHISKPITIGGTATETNKTNIFFRLDYISSVLQNGSPIGYFRVWNLKVEKGERSTPWSAAPSDYSTTEEIKTGITVKENAISIFGKDVSLQGKITFSSLNSSLQSTINNKADSGDVTSDINSSKEDMAKKLGYASYADMVSAATAGNTIIEGGHIRTSLIETDALVVKTLNATNVDGINTLVNKEGIRMTEGSNELFKLKYQRNTEGTTRYYAQLDLTTRYSDGSTLQGTLTPESLFLRGKTKSTAKTLKTTLKYDGLNIYDEDGMGTEVNTKGVQLTYCGKTQSGEGICAIVSYAKCIFSAYIYSSGVIHSRTGGGIPNSSKILISFSIEKTATGTYKVTHNIGDTSYKVQITPVRGSYFPITCVREITSSYFVYSTAKYTQTNGTYGFANSDCAVFLNVYYNSPLLFAS